MLQCYPFFPLLPLDLLLQDALQRHGVRRELGYALPQLLDRHLLLVEVEAERRLVADVRLLFNVETMCLGRVQLLGDGRGRVEQIFQQRRLDQSEKSWA